VKTVTVELGPRGYPIHIGAETRSQLPPLLDRLGGVRKVAVIADARVADLHLDTLEPCIPNLTAVLHFEPGEASKSLATVASFLDGLAEARLERSDLVLTFGGGVAGDMGGFAAACWLRGIRYVQVPTTIEAGVDASVGGKTGVNHAAGKNLIGAFHQPSGVVIDIDFLETLDQRDFIAGLAESVKHAAIRDGAFFDWHEQHVKAILGRKPDSVAELLARNCAIKAAVVAADEREAGLRAILNYGHTIGHAIERLTDYQLRHGEAVALGIVAENAIAVGRGLMSAADAARVRELFTALGLPVMLAEPLDPEAVIDRCRLDKKNRGGEINCVVVRQWGATERLDDVTAEEIRTALSALSAN
jgi:3-dehydroquinate synthase